MPSPQSPGGCLLSPTKRQCPHLILVSLLVLPTGPLAGCSRKSPTAAPSDLVHIDKSEIDLRFHSLFFQSSAAPTNREWTCFLVNKSPPVSDEARRQMAAIFWNRPVTLTDGPRTLATGQISSVVWDTTRGFAGYSILFRSPETIIALEKELGIRHPELPQPPAGAEPPESR